MKAKDLRGGAFIPTTLCGTLLILDVHVDVDPDQPNGDLDRVYVDVVIDDNSTRWDPDDLPATTGAGAVQWLGLRRYRLVYLPDTDVNVIPPSPGGSFHLDDGRGSAGVTRWVR